MKQNPRRRLFPRLLEIKILREADRAPRIRPSARIENPSGRAVELQSAIEHFARELRAERHLEYMMRNFDPILFERNGNKQTGAYGRSRGNRRHRDRARERSLNVWGEAEIFRELERVFNLELTELNRYA